MPKLVILYGHPDDPAAFEDYYANRHLPYAGEHMPNVRAAENIRIIGTSDGTAPAYYRISELTDDTLDELHAGIASEEGRSVIADLDNFATGGSTLLIGAD